MAKMARLGVGKLMELEHLSRLERFDRMQRRSNTRYAAVSREDYAANLRRFAQPVGVASSENKAEEGPNKHGRLILSEHGQ